MVSASIDGFVRIAMVENEHRIRQAVRSIKAFLTASERPAKPAPRRALAS